MSPKEIANDPHVQMCARALVVAELEFAKHPGKMQDAIERGAKRVMGEIEKYDFETWVAPVMDTVTRQMVAGYKCGYVLPGANTGKTLWLFIIHQDGRENPLEDVIDEP